MKSFYLLTLLPVLSLLYAKQASSEQYQIAIQPVLPQSQLQQIYQPLADYLSTRTGHEFKITTYKNFLTYWERMKRQNGFDFVLDAAHFTDWRVKRHNYTVLAKLPDSVSFSLVTHEDNLVIDADELIMKKIATMPSPGLGAVRLNEIYPNPVRLPVFIQSTDSMMAINKVIEGKADAAIIPTPMLSRAENLNLVETTRQVPHMGFSVSANVSKEVSVEVKRALVDATKNPGGKKMLSRLNIQSFQSAENATYDGYASLLEDVFGY